MVTANILTDTITLIDTKTDSLVAMLACDAGCHGVQWKSQSIGAGFFWPSWPFFSTKFNLIS